ncbi:MAG: TIGR01212 family radical SAM protein [Lachnospiraceae bacterium]
MDGTNPGYYSLNQYLQETFGEKVYKVLINGGFTCPNRDGTVGTGGCIFCSASGSGDFTPDAGLSVTDQIDAGIAAVRQKRPGQKYIAYFQAFTNTYAPIERLRSLYMEALSHPDIVALSIGTRPDCLSDEVIALLDECNRIKPVWVELGLQTIHEASADYIRRGYPLSVFDDAVYRLHQQNLTTIVHLILGIPGETTNHILDSIHYLNELPIQGVKLSLLHVLSGTDMGKEYLEHPFPTYTLEEYANLVADCIGHLRPDIVLHRITGDGPKDLLIAPLWSLRKREVMNSIYHTLKERRITQGIYLR